MQWKNIKLGKVSQDFENVRGSVYWAVGSHSAFCALWQEWRYRIECGVFSEIVMISWFVEVYNDLILFCFSLFVVFQIPLISFGNLGQLLLLM